MIKRLPLLMVLAACQTAPAVDGLPTLDPKAAGFSPAALDSIGMFLESKAGTPAYPGGVLLVGTADGVVYARAFGTYSVTDDRPVQLTTIYDLASLTKVIGLTTGLYILLTRNELGLDDPVVRYIPTFTGQGKDRITIRQLLTHTSGLKAWLPLHLETPDQEGAYQRIDADTLEHEPGTHYTYSDLGAITLGRVVAAISGTTLDDYLDTAVFAPLGMHDTRFNPPDSLLDRIAPTEVDSVWRHRLVHGTVHDENAQHLGGVSGHAGLFSTAPDLARFAIWILNAYHGRLAPGDQPYLPADFVRMATARQPGPEGSTRALGWDTPTPGGGASSGSLLSPNAFGHTGFTGTSIWIDPSRGLYIILLTNRVNPTRENRELLTIRGEVADMVIRAREQ